MARPSVGFEWSLRRAARLSARKLLFNHLRQAVVRGPDAVAIFDALHDQLGELLFAGFAKMGSAFHQKVS
jgi:hypothetical protein